MVIKQGDLYWIDLGEPAGSEPGYRRPFVVIQNNVFNLSKLNTVVVCALSSNLKRAASPGNVTLEKQEANLSKPSVVVVTQVFTVDKHQLEDYIGTLPKRRVLQILNGILDVLQPREVD